jgi:hypothetical protein
MDLPITPVICGFIRRHDRQVCAKSGHSGGSFKLVLTISFATIGGHRGTFVLIYGAV